MYKLGQSVVSSIVLFIFIVVGIILVALLSVVTTPLLQSFVSANGLTGGFAILVNHFNFVLISILLFVGLLVVVAGGNQ